MNTIPFFHPVRQNRLLRIALWCNALFSISCALVMLAAPGTVAGWLGLQTAWVIQMIGVGLLLFATDLLHQATRPRMASWRGLYASLTDFAWVGGTALLLVAVPGWFSPGGVALLLGVAAVVLLFGFLQFWGVKRLHELPESNGHYRHCVLVDANVSAQSMWNVVARLDEISRFMPALKSSSIRDGQSPGAGCVRQCEDRSGKQWAEECTSFDPQVRSFEVRFLCDEPGFPFPATTMCGGWKVNPIGKEACEVMIWWELVPKPRWLAPVLMPLLAFQVDRDFPNVIASMAAAAMGNRTLGTARSPVVRLAPRFC